MHTIASYQTGESMGHLNVHWSDCLENLAKAMFRDATDRTDPFETECTVVGSPVMAGWLKQFFLYDFPKAEKKQHVLACWDFQMLHPFVNDWLAKACKGTEIGQRNPAGHAYSPEALQWRIWNLLRHNATSQKYASLNAYIGNAPQASDRKRLGLAQRLAKLFDDYQNYRRDLLDDWATGKDTGLTPEHCWQAEMWRQLVQENPGTYARQFVNIQDPLSKCGIDDTYRRITVFHVSTMPRAYMEFFAVLGTFMPVEMFIFNPSQEFWADDPTTKQHYKMLIRDEKNLAWLDPPHPLLSGFGRGTQALLATVTDVEEQQMAIINDSSALWGENKDDTLLRKLQQNIRARSDPREKSALFTNARKDDSLQFHICHSPLREVEIVHDLILKWFDENRHLAQRPQPRDVQVLVSDMETYAPFIESAFDVTDPKPRIPCSISKRPALSAGAIGAAFVKLMHFSESRMSAPETIELLELEPVRERYGLESDDISAIRTLVNEANIRWGRNAQHINQTITPDTRHPTSDTRHPIPDTSSHIPDTVTWRRGLDRLIAGFAIGRCADGDDLINAGELGALRICDDVESSSAELVGKLSCFYQDLCHTVEERGAEENAVDHWTEHFRIMLDRFFRSTENTFREIAEIRRSIATVETGAQHAGFPKVAAGVVAAAIEAQLGGTAPGGKCDTNVILFSPMQTMQAAPRKLLIMLGMNEGVFPRVDQRPAFDLLASNPRYGDRSLRYEDRLAFLEAIMSARERLVITSTGRNISNNREIPPSPAATELLQYLQVCAPDKDKPLIEPTEHKLHGFNPAYFEQGGQLFSYSQSNYEAAGILTANGQEAKSDAWEENVKQETPPEKPQPMETIPITLENLQAFFRNPAKHYYIHALNIRLPDPARDALQESEMFEADTLDNYKLNQIVLEDILAQDPSCESLNFEPDDDYFKWLEEQALTPLGPLGRGYAASQIYKLQEFLDTQSISERYGSLYRCLRALNGAKRNPLRIDAHSGHYHISAALPILELPGYSDVPRYLLFFRYANIKPKDCLDAWLAHVVGHAYGESFETIIAGKSIENSRKIDCNILPPMESKLAVNVLREIIALYDRGTKTIIPFSPATSYAYAEEMVNEGNQVKAMEDAEKAWGGYGSTENADAYLYKQWRDEGPMAHAGFEHDALAFWQYFFPPLEDGSIDDSMILNLAEDEDA